MSRAVFSARSQVPVCPVKQCFTQLPGAIEVKLLRKSKNGTTGGEREDEGKGRAGMK